MADGEDVQPLVCDNGSGMVKVSMDFRNVFKAYVFIWFWFVPQECFSVFALGRHLSPDSVAMEAFYSLVSALYSR